MIIKLARKERKNTIEKAKKIKMETTYHRILSSGCNLLSHRDNMFIRRFLSGQARSHPFDTSRKIYRISFHETLHESPNGTGAWREYIVFEVNFDTGSWRKLRRTVTRVNTQNNVIKDKGVDANGILLDSPFEYSIDMPIR